MKPLSLEFTAFGSYPGTEKVDFDSLTELGLYVVTGPTGSGKTTIFDAMAYALYGEVPGARDKGDVRSQHAHADATCSVVLRFAVDGEVHRVERTPEQFRPRLRGDGDPVKVAARAVLVRESDDVSLASQPKKVTAACVELIGLDADQFERVVLLPQGQFQEFLLANTATRLPLLRQLFGTGKWLTVVEELKARANDAKSVVADIEDQLRQHHFAISGALQAAHDLLPNADEPTDSDVDEQPVDSEPTDEQSLDDLATRLTGLTEKSAPLRDNERQLNLAADTALAAHTTALSIIDSWDKRVQLLAERKVLDEQSGDLTERRSERDEARRAEPVLATATTERRNAAESVAAQKRLDEHIEALSGASIQAQIGALRDPDVAADALVAARATNDAHRTALNELSSASQLLAQLEKRKSNLEAEHTEGTQRCEDVTTLLLPRQTEKLELEALAATEPECRVQVEKAQELLRQRQELASIGALIPQAQTAQDDAVALQRLAIKAFDDSAAPRLAESLVPGDACPVCGSHEHPAPAASDGDQSVDSATRDAAAQSVMDATQELLRLDNRQKDLVTSLGVGSEKPVEEFAAQSELATSKHKAAVDAATKLKTVIAQIDAAEAEKSVITSRLAEIGLELAAVEPQITTTGERCDSLRGNLGELAAAWEKDPSGARDAMDVIADALTRLETGIAACRQSAQAVTTAEGMATSSATALAEALVASSFATFDDAQAVALSAEQLVLLDSTIADFDTRDAANQILLSENLTLDLPESRPDASDLELAAQTTRAAAEAASDALSQITGHLELARRNLTDAEAIDGGSKDAFDRSKSLQSLAKTCDGQGPKRIALETWVLAGELERVAAAANHHLQKMTNGRYQIERSDDSGHAGKQSGLDLRVLDAHTGSSRRPGSLSGGEQFQASLALALGLADVIGHGGNANGRVFEALFVDEGFGSLDPDSLDQAVDALTHIQAGGRTVGVITHVEAMKDSLAMGIRVDRLPNGKGSTLTVRPNG
ncbi:SbcC ATPase involved in DNA repair [Acidimicrobiia bacterium]